MKLLSLKHEKDGKFYHQFLGTRKELEELQKGINKLLSSTKDQEEIAICSMDDNDFLFLKRAQIK